MSYAKYRQDYLEVVIANGGHESEIIDFRQYEGGFIHTPTAWTDANIGFEMAYDRDGPYSIARDEDGAALEISGIATDASGSFAMPTALKGAQFIKLWSKNTSTEADVAQAAERTVSVTLKG
jgi:hypothetical protein